MEKSPYRKCLQNTSGRMFTREIEREMGIISISRTGFFPAGTFGLQEDYDLTLEALKGYITSLKESGMLCIQLFLLPPPRYELRLMNNIILAMYGLRIESPDRHLIVLRSWDTMSFFVKKSPFTIEELRKISDFAESREFDVVFPDLAVSRTFITGPDYRDIFMNLMHWKGLSVVKENYPFDIGVTTDDKPFLHYFLRLKHIKEIYALTGRKWTYFLYEGMALPFVLMFLSIFSIALFVATFLFFRRGNSNSKQLTCNFELTTLCYFAVIGFAFMFIEVFFIHLFILPLGSPAASFATVLVTLLLSTGFGSIMSGYVKGKKVFYAMCTILFLLMMYYLLPAYLYTYSFSFLFLIPTGFLLGFYFPAGIKLLCGHDSRTIPLAYAMNGAASIISPPLASVIAVSLGLKILLILSCVLYGLAILIIGNKLYLMHRPAGHFISSEPLRSLEQR